MSKFRHRPSNTTRTPGLAPPVMMIVFSFNVEMSRA